MSFIGTTDPTVPGAYLWDGTKLVQTDPPVTSVTETTNEVITVSPTVGDVVLSTPYLDFDSTNDVWAVGEAINTGVVTADAVAMGTAILAPGGNVSQCVLLGTRIMHIRGAAGGPSANSVLIGTDVHRGAAATNDDVIIGAGSGQQTTSTLESARNVIVGGESGQSLAGATDNVAIGYRAGQDLSSGATQNVLVGTDAGVNITTGDANIIVGFSSGQAITTGSRNIIIGPALNFSTDVSDQLSIGVGNAGVGLITGDQSNPVNNRAVCIQPPTTASASAQAALDIPLTVFARVSSTNGLVELNTASVGGGARVRLFTGTFNPNTDRYGSTLPLSGSNGDVFMRANGASSTMYVCEGGTTWNDLRDLAGLISVVVDANAAVGTVADPGANSMTTYVLTNAGARTISLPATAANGSRITVKDGAGSGSPIAVTVSGGGNIDFSASYNITTVGGSATFQWDSASGQWWVN